MRRTNPNMLRRRRASVHLDLETYSEVDLKAGGLYKYARSASTDVLCACWRYRGHGVDLPEGRYVWRPGEPAPGKLLDLVHAGLLCVAHNAAFEAEIWRWVLTRYGWEWPGYGAFLDAMAAAQISNLPGDLARASRFFSGGVEKDKEGHRLMMRMCKPAPPKASDADPRRFHTPESLERLVSYCKTDVDAEISFSENIPELQGKEEALWRLTWKANRRGVAIDLPLVRRCQEIAVEAQAHYRQALYRATDGHVSAETLRARFARWLEGEGVEVPTTDKGNPTIGKNVRRDIDWSNASEKALEAFRIYDLLNKSSLAKFTAMQSQVCSDGRLRGTLCYSGAGQTGRWAGRGVQLQNLPKGLVETEHGYQTMVDMVMDGADWQELELCYGSAMAALSTLIRPCLIPGPGMCMQSADYSAIEGRGLAWLAGEQKVLRAYQKGLRMYAVAAAGIFGVPYDAVVAAKKDGDGSMDAAGKVAELACGYQGAVGAMVQMGGLEAGLTREQLADLVAKWRNDRPLTVALWYNMQDAAIEAIEHPMRTVRVKGTEGRVAFGYNGQNLKMRLPSGRCLWYRSARVTQKVWPDGGTSPQVEYYGVDEGRVGWISTYGGCFTENAVQALCRDIMADAMLAADAEGWALLFTVHDELVTEDKRRDHGALCDVMLSAVPLWAEGLPISVAGYTGNFYRKG